RWSPNHENKKRGAPGTLGNVLVYLAILVGPGAETLDGSDDHPRIELLNALPGESHAIQRAGSEVLHQHIATLHQLLENLLAGRTFGVESDGALVVVEHGEVKAVGVRNVAQLLACHVARAGALDLDHIRAEPRQQLCTGGTRLHVCEIENAHSIQCLAHRNSPCRIALQSA